MNTADIIIVGGGIAGLYAAYKHPGKSIILIEKDKHFGGRAGTKKFRGASIVTGAGIGRLHKDHLLAALMREMDLPVNTWPLRGHLKPAPLRLLKKHAPSTSETFEHFAKRVLGPAEFSQWIADLGYTDLLKANAYDTVYNYGLEDFVETKTGFSVPWAELVKRLKNKLKIKYVNECTALDINESAKTLKTTKGNFTWNEKLIIAAPIDTIRELLPSVPEYKYIRGQPFSRVYAQFAHSLDKPLVTELTIVKGPLQKIIPIDVDKRIYMIAYNDNVAAKSLINKFDDRAYFSKLVAKALGTPPHHIEHMRIFYWPIGTHYTAPHPFDPKAFRAKLLNPRPSIYVVGESVSEHQGWTEGAFETVINILKNEDDKAPVK